MAPRPPRPGGPLDARFDFHPFRVRFVLPEPVLESGWQTFDSSGGAGGEHPGVAALLALDGVQVVGLHQREVVVIRDPEVPWESILRDARDIIRDHFLGRPAWRRPARAPAASEAPPG